MNKEEIEKAKKFMANIGQTIKENKMFFNEERITIKAGEKTAQNIKTFLQYIQELERENKTQNKIIDEMSKQLTGWATFDNELQKTIMLYTQKQVKQYFEKKVE